MCDKFTIKGQTYVSCLHILLHLCQQTPHSVFLIHQSKQHLVFVLQEKEEYRKVLIGPTCSFIKKQNEGSSSSWRKWGSRSSIRLWVHIIYYIVYVSFFSFNDTFCYHTRIKDDEYINCSKNCVVANKTTRIWNGTEGILCIIYYLCFPCCRLLWIHTQTWVWNPPSPYDWASRYQSSMSVYCWTPRLELYNVEKQRFNWFWIKVWSNCNLYRYVNTKSYNFLQISARSLPHTY